MSYGKNNKKNRFDTISRLNDDINSYHIKSQKYNKLFIKVLPTNSWH